MTTNDSSPQTFSTRLRKWLASKEPKTLGDLYEEFDDKSFALFFLILMAIPALPLPTGGVTHIFEIITMLLALEMVAGRRTVWLSRALLRRPLGKTLQDRGLPKLITYIQKAERFSRPRLSGWLRNREFLRLVGLLVLVLTIAAFIAPPFSGLDTLPSLGVVFVAFALMF